MFECVFSSYAELAEPISLKVGIVGQQKPTYNNSKKHTILPLNYQIWKKKPSDLEFCLLQIYINKISLRGHLHIETELNIKICNINP